MNIFNEQLNRNLRCDRFSNYREAFQINKGEIISLVGGGGKTTLMFALARELSSVGGLVVTTTTTRIIEPLSSQTEALYLDTDEEAIITWLTQNTEKYNHVTIARKNLASGKLAGISPELVSRIASLKQVSAIIVEADGAARKPLKAPNATEPVVPSDTTIVIPVVGIEALGQPLSQEHVFRPEIVSALLGLPLGEVITAESIAILVTHEQGMAKGSPVRAKIVPFINKVDSDSLRLKAMDVAITILAKGLSRIGRVVLGQANAPQPMLTVLSLKPY